MYQKMYTILFDAITKSLRDLEEGDLAAAKWKLEEAQREAENLFMDWDWENSAEPEEELGEPEKIPAGPPLDIFHA